MEKKRISNYTVGVPLFKNTRETDTNVPAIKKQNAITLLALVITIIVLLILAGVVLNLTLGEHGILKKAEQSSEQYKISEILEKLELEKVDLYARKNGELPSVKEYIDHLITKGIITASDVEDIDKDTKNITVEGYVFLVEKETSGNIKITYQRKADNKPRIAKIEVTKTTINSISVKTITSNVKEGSYKYSIKDLTLGEESFTLVTTLETNEYTFTGLTIDHEYIVQVEIVAEKGGDTKQTDTIKTEPPKVTSITLDKTEIELLKGKTETITAEILPEDAMDKTLTWTSSNEEVVTVDSTGKVTGAGEGKALVTVTSSNGVSVNCNVTVTLPPPGSLGAETHIAKEIQYSWEELNELAKIISNNYGKKAEGKIDNDVAEVNVSINGKSGTLGIGDWTTVKYNGVAKKVRILGFNHDTLTDTGVYGGTNTYAGISFEFVDYLMNELPNGDSYTTTGGWGACKLRGTLNSTTIIQNLENEKYIKQVNKQYIKTYNEAGSVTISKDKLWLLACSEIWNNGRGSRPYGYAITSEGKQYKYYKNINSDSGAYNTVLKKSTSSNDDWWTRSPNASRSNQYCIVSNGACVGGYMNGKDGVAPGFAI